MLMNETWLGFDKHLIYVSNIILINIYFLKFDASMSPLQVIRSFGLFDQLNSKLVEIQVNL